MCSGFTTIKSHITNISRVQTRTTANTPPSLPGTEEQLKKDCAAATAVGVTNRATQLSGGLSPLGVEQELIPRSEKYAIVLLPGTYVPYVYPPQLYVARYASAGCAKNKKKRTRASLASKHVVALISTQRRDHRAQLSLHARCYTKLQHLAALA